MGNEHLNSKGIIHHSKNRTHIVSAKDPNSDYDFFNLSPTKLHTATYKSLNNFSIICHFSL